MNYIKLYEQQIKEDKAELNLSEAIEQIDEAILIAAISVALVAGILFRIIDGIKGNKPKITHYIKGIIKWAFSEYSNGSLSINAIRKSAYEVMKEDNEFEDEFGPSFSKILSKKILNGLTKGSKEFAKILGEAIGRIAKRAGLSENELNRMLENPS